MTMSTMFTFFIIFSSLYLSSASRVGPSYGTLTLATQWPNQMTSFNVDSFGARGDGRTDSTQAFQDAWKAACDSPTPSQIYVPNGEYLLNPIRFEGHGCKSSILFSIDGTLAPNDPKVVAATNGWINFHQIDGLHIKGGVIDAKGQIVWSCKATGSHCPSGARSMSFESSKNIIVDGLTSINSQMFHITLNYCQNFNMGGLNITAPGDSPNTDGIHIERSDNITIMHSQIQTGDDCISIGPNNKDIWIESVICGPGHGISIGSLGRDSGDEGLVVQNVTVKDATFTDTQNGLRIKTWASAVRGSVKDVFYLGANMNNVHNPIIIDQNYCPHGSCSKGEASGIQITNVVYQNIKGTSASEEAMTLNCSAKSPCTGLTLQDINLSYNSMIPKCESSNVSGKIVGTVQPSDCLHFV